MRYHNGQSSLPYPHADADADADANPGAQPYASELPASYFVSKHLALERLPNLRVHALADSGGRKRGRIQTVECC
jgi:hypothetical protein